MTQSRLASLLESCFNILIGFSVSVAANALILPLYGMPFSFSVTFQIGLWFTLISLVRSYLVRRLFNRLHSKGWLQ